MKPVHAAPMKHQKQYTEEAIYDNIIDAVQEFENDIDTFNLKMGSVISRGEFTDVCKGTLIQNGKTLVVAIKMLKVTSFVLLLMKKIILFHVSQKVFYVKQKG